MIGSASLVPAIATCLAALAAPLAASAEVVLRDDFSNNAEGGIDGVEPDVGIPGQTWQTQPDGSGAVIEDGELTSAGGRQNARFNIASKLTPGSRVVIEATVDVIGKSHAWIGLASKDQEGSIREFGDTDVLWGLFENGSTTFGTNHPERDWTTKEVFYNDFAKPLEPTGPISVTLTYDLVTGEAAARGEFPTAEGTRVASWRGNVRPTGGQDLFPPDELRYVFLESDGEASFESVTVRIEN